ncbi:hypothetical protein SmB9_07190 [Sphingosinicella microcystinivorans]|uniref:Uncharacterized protein n=1 Tax=Sphingosinicella microcystinivorans TaxID=335406 RepID=A0AAD1D4Z0_SPHMI|nr:hypothetical protein SmB9_07190 [Sphingosinicella microcystinivorans]
MAEPSERQAALPACVGKPDGLHDARIERSARFKCEPSLPEARATVAHDMDRLRAVRARSQIDGRTELDRRLDIPELRLARRKKTMNDFGLDEQAPTYVALPVAVGYFDRIVGKDRLRGEVPMGNGISDRTRPAGEEIANAKSAFPMS